VQRNRCELPTANVTITINKYTGLANGHNIVFLTEKDGIFYVWFGMDEKAPHLNPQCKIFIKIIVLILLCGIGTGREVIAFLIWPLQPDLTPQRGAHKETPKIDLKKHELL
jgi:hypothetical protein